MLLVNYGRACHRSTRRQSCTPAVNMTTEHTVWLLVLQLCHKPNLSFVLFCFFFNPAQWKIYQSYDATAQTQTLVMHFVEGGHAHLKEWLGPIC